MSEAADRWRHDLEGRAIPPAILDAAPESPWRYPTELFRRRAERAGAGAPTPTTIHAGDALPDGGTVLDVGCGSGATSLSLAGTASLLVGVDGSAEMLETFRTAAAARGVEAQTLEGTWPGVAGTAPVCDVVVCGHVLYNVPDLPTFLRALDAHAGRRVVVELTQRHPLAWMNDLWVRFHEVRFPEGPTADDAAAVAEDLGFSVERDERNLEAGRGHSGFERKEDAVALVRRRLCLPPERDEEVVDALGDRLRSDEDGLWSAGPVEQTNVTLWWDVSRGTPPRT